MVRHASLFSQLVGFSPSSRTLFQRLQQLGSFCSHAILSNADYTVIEERRVPANRNIMADQLIQFNGYTARKKCPHILRRVSVWDKEQDREIVLLTNHLGFGATTISAIYSAIYKDRGRLNCFSRL